MKLSALSPGKIHIIGIGGIGMSGIAEILYLKGQDVQGSDIALSPNVERLQSKGIQVFVGHDASHVREASVVVYSTDVPSDNMEILEARRQGIPIINRAEMLAELMRFYGTIAISGTHGKTTTTSLIGGLLENAGWDPTVINGGIVNSYGTNTRIGKGEWMVVEADESDGTFVKVPATIAVVTNIDPEHLTYYGSYENLIGHFERFIHQIPFYGFSVICHDHPVIASMIPKIIDRRYISYGMHPDAHVRATNVTPTPKGMVFDAVIKDGQETIILEKIRVALHGEHNVLNSLSAIAIGHYLRIAHKDIRKTLENFQGVKRRFTTTGTVKGATIIDDYAHHPTEIQAVLRAAKGMVPGRIFTVMQPHRYSRLKDLFPEFVDSFKNTDSLYITPIYSAGETLIPGLDHHVLAKAIEEKGHRAVNTVESIQQLADALGHQLKEGDYVIFMGAGSITKWAHEFPELAK